MIEPAAFAALDGRGRLHLVLDGTRRPLEVHLDGLALRIIQPPTADALAPVRRIDRVTCRGAVTWESSALAALAEAGAPVGLVAERGRLVAVLVGPALKGRHGFAEALARVVDHPDLNSRIEDWRRATISKLARRFGLGDPAAAARDGWAGGEAAIAAMAPPPLARARRVAREARTFTTLLARRALAEAGCPPDWVGATGLPGRDLSPVFGQIALWHLALRLRGPAASARLATALDADLTSGRAKVGVVVSTVAELARPRLRRHLAADLERFRSFLLDLAHAGPPIARDRRWRG